MKHVCCGSQEELLRVSVEPTKRMEKGEYKRKRDRGQPPRKEYSQEYVQGLVSSLSENSRKVKREQKNLQKQKQEVQRAILTMEEHKTSIRSLELELSARHEEIIKIGSTIDALRGEKEELSTCLDAIQRIDLLTAHLPLFCQILKQKIEFFDAEMCKNLFLCSKQVQQVFYAMWCEKLGSVGLSSITSSVIPRTFETIVEGDLVVPMHLNGAGEKKESLFNQTIWRTLITNDECNKWISLRGGMAEPILCIVKYIHDGKSVVFHLIPHVSTEANNYCCERKDEYFDIVDSKPSSQVYDKFFVPEITECNPFIVHDRTLLHKVPHTLSSTADSVFRYLNFILKSTDIVSQYNVEYLGKLGKIIQTVKIPKELTEERQSVIQAINNTKDRITNARIRPSKTTMVAVQNGFSLLEIVFLNLYKNYMQYTTQS